MLRLRLFRTAGKPAGDLMAFDLQRRRCPWKIFLRPQGPALNSLMRFETLIRPPDQVFRIRRRVIQDESSMNAFAAILAHSNNSALPDLRKPVENSFDILRIDIQSFR